MTNRYDWTKFRDCLRMRSISTSSPKWNEFINNFKNSGKNLKEYAETYTGIYKDELDWWINYIDEKEDKKMIKNQKWLNENYYSALEEINCCKYDDSFVTEIQFRNCPKLKKIDKLNGFSLLGLIKIENCSELEEINLSNNSNNCKKIIVKNCPKLKKIHAEKLELKEIEIINCPNLEEIFVSGNLLESFGGETLPKLKSLDISNNSLRFLDVSQFSNLQLFWYKGNSKLPGLDLKNLTQLVSVSFDKLPSLPGNEWKAKIAELQAKINLIENQALPFWGEERSILNTKDQEIKQKQNQIQDLETKLNSLIEASKNHVLNNVQKITEINQLKEEIQNLKVEKLKLGQEKENLIDNHQRESKENLEKWEKEHEQLISEINKFLQEKKQLKDENKHLKEDNEQLETNQQKLTEQIKELNNQLKQTKTQLNEEKQKKRTVEKSLQELKKLLKGKIEPEYVEQIIKNSQGYEKVVRELADKNQQKQQDLKRLQEQAQSLEQVKDNIQKLEQEKQDLERELTKTKSQKSTFNQDNAKQTTNLFAWWAKSKQLIYTIGGGIIGLLGFVIVYRLAKEVDK